MMLKILAVSLNSPSIKLIYKLQFFFWFLESHVAAYLWDIKNNLTILLGHEHLQLKSDLNLVFIGQCFSSINIGFSS